MSELKTRTGECGGACGGSERTFLPEDRPQMGPQGIIWSCSVCGSLHWLSWSLEKWTNLLPIELQLYSSRHVVQPDKTSMDDLTSSVHLKRWLDIAGLQTGLGGRRPEESGVYGRFTAASIDTE